MTDFTVNEVASGGTLSVKKGKTLSINSKVAAYLPVSQDSIGTLTARTAPDKMPYWDIERARDGQSRNVKVELVINGKPVAAQEMAADGKVHDLHFDYMPESSCWAAVRIYPSSHSNPIFIEIDGKPVHEKKSAEWCISALDQCWKMKEPNIRAEEKQAARQAYDDARKVYQKIMNAY